MGITWLSVESASVSGERACLEEVISQAYHIMSSVAEDEDNSELNDTDYSEFEEGSSRSLFIIIHLSFYFNLVVCRCGRKLILF